jgi:signal transduction histidine kinase
LLAYRQEQTDRVLVWDFREDSRGGACEESDRPPRDAGAFLLQAGALAFLGQALDTLGGGRWLVAEAEAAPREKRFEVPPRFREEFAPRSLASVPLRASGGWNARLFLLDADTSAFTPAQLDDLRELLEGLGPVLANLLTVRSLVAERVGEERERIVRHLHDGIAQTLASIEMQLEVFRRQAGEEPARAAEGLARLHQAVRREQAELRRYLRTLQPVRVPAAELHRRLLAHCAQFQQETGIEVDVTAEPVEETLPEGVCREVFQILREALHNVRKHAEAKHVLVRFEQENTMLRLTVDDDGRGYPFSGTFSLPTLEEQGLAPVSIAEHTRALGGWLTIDSTPGSGATLRVEIPLT